MSDIYHFFLMVGGLELQIRRERETNLPRLRHARDEVVVTEGQEVSLTVSPPVEQSWILELGRRLFSGIFQ